ncbi:helix-turn-helix domain-containing protein [Paremcibacter congregatus]|uniref:helix-turn-helix domain-containing protein n=1 Tax=Paremcibacter congregatus TaxID=2043170 RepID=UPI003A8E6666
MALLSKYSVIESNDLAELQEMITDFSGPVRLKINQKGAEVAANMAVAMVGEQPVLHGTFGAARVDWHSDGECDDTMLLFAPTAGGGEITHLGQTWGLSTNTGMMRDLGLEATAYQEQFHSFVLPISKDKIREHARNLGGDHLGLVPVEFDPVADFSTTGGKMLKQYLNFIASSLNDGVLDQGNALMTSQICDLLMTQVLTQMKNNVQDMLTGQNVAHVVPRYVKRAQDYIHSNPAEALDMNTLSQIAGCSYRTLQRGFAEAFDQTPHQYIRKVRLQFVRRELLDIDNKLSIMAIARKWGFGHMGRFAQEYAQEFGHRPTETTR